MWGLYFKNPGSWGPGTGRLTSLQADSNTNTLAQKIQEKAVQGVGVVDVVMSGGNQLYFVLSDHSYIGPVTIPVVAWSPKGAWQPLTAYLAYDVVSYGSTLYLVLIAHTSQVAFDSNANDGAGHNYYQLLVAIPPSPPLPPPVQTQGASTFAPLLTDANTYNVMTNTSGCMVTIPQNSSIAFPVSTEISFRQETALGVVSIAASLPVTIHPVSGYLNETGRQGATITIKKVAPDAWDIFGLLEPHP